ncbi:MAG: ADP-ribosylglycohydrolase family protein [Microthrixaceae bacterium]
MSFRLPDRARWKGSLLGAAVGDCLGAPFEGTAGPLSVDEWARFEQDDSPLAYTDDTAMTLAFAESLARVGGLDEDDLASSFAEHWAEAPALGYSTRTAELLERIRSGTRWQDAHHGNGRASNGAAMRVAPAALFAAGRLDLTIELARRSALVTHRHPGAVAGACVQAAALATALRHPGDVPIVADHFVRAVRAATTDPLLHERLNLAAAISARGDAAEISERIGSGLLASESVPAAICAFLSHPASFPDAVALAVRLGSDTDTVASMTAAISGALLGEAAIPARWLARAQCGDQVGRLADALHNASQRPNLSSPLPNDP